MYNRPLSINTKFFDEDIYHPQQLSFNKQGAIIQLDNKIKTLIFKRLLLGWNSIRHIQSQYYFDSIKEEAKNVQQRLKSNVKSIREMNKGMMSGMSSEKKYKSLSPTCSSMGQSRALILSEIVSKLKHRHNDHQDNYLKKSLNKLQRMLGNIKVQHSKTERGTHKVTKLFTKDHFEHSSNINAQQCLRQIEILKQQLQFIKKAQQNLWKNRNQQSVNQLYQKKSVVQSFPTMINILNEPISQQSTHRYEVRQPKVLDYRITSRHHNQFQQSKIVNTISQKQHQPVYFSPYQANSIICQNCCKSQQRKKQSFKFINNQLNSSNFFQHPLSKSTNNSFNLVQKPRTIKLASTLTSSIYQADDRIFFNGKPHFKKFI